MNIEVGGFIVLVDEEDASLLTSDTWRIRRANKTHYCTRSSRGGDNRRTQYLHRVVLGLAVGDRQEVDHINGNGLDCRRTNLRIASRSVQCRNRHNTHGQHGMVGVELIAYRKKSRHPNPWRARIEISGKARHLGYFPSKEGAHHAWRIATDALINQERRAA